MRIPRALWRGTALALLAASIPTLAVADADLDLRDAVRQALESNLDLAAQLHALESNREEIGIERSALLPQVTLGSQGGLSEQDRSHDPIDKNRKKSFQVGAALNQVLYDEDDWASFSIRKHEYAQQVQQFDAFRLGIVSDAATAFLELDRSREVLAVQRRNREITGKNLETSSARVAAGWSSDREKLRWQSQLAGNDTDVRSAEVLVLQNQFELNRLRNRPPESPVEPLPASLEEYGFVYARESVARSVAAPEADRRMRDYLVRIGLARSPDLVGLDASIAAAERQLVANRRAFWLPSLSVSAGANHVVKESNQPGGDWDANGWSVGGTVEFPLFSGAGKFYEYDAANATLASLRTERRGAALTVEQSIRSAFAQASGSYANIAFARRELEAARRNFELVDASYVLGVDSILDLLDAQDELLASELSVVEARYGFLEDLVFAERQLALFPFLEPPDDVDSILEGIEQELGARP